MKTTVELPDELFRRVKAGAALRGESLKVYFREALERRLGLSEIADGEPGWRRVFGHADAAAVAEVDAVVERDFEEVDPEDWR